MADFARFEIESFSKSPSAFFKRIESEYILRIEKNITISEFQKMISDPVLDGDALILFLEILRHVGIKIRWHEAILVSTPELMHWNHDEFGDPIQAVQIGYDALECVSLKDCLEKPDFESQYNMILFNIANGWLSLGRYKKSIALFQEALDLAEKRDDRLSVAQIYQNLGVCYRGINDLFKAKECYKTAFRIYEKMNHPSADICWGNLRSIEVDLSFPPNGIIEISGIKTTSGFVIKHPNWDFYKPEQTFPIIPFKNRELDDCPLSSNQWLRSSTGLKYEIKEGLGSGGAGVVYKALIEGIKELVAIKVLAPDYRFRSSPSMRERFEREIQRLQSLSPDFLVAIRDRGTVFGYPYYVMDFCTGGSLRDRIDQDTLSTEGKLAVMVRIAECIDYIHSMKLIHRDLKPDNIMFKDGRALISDLGLARSVIEEDMSLTETGAIIGSKDYMSPEQRKNPKEVTKATDYYSFGVILYELFSGELPRAGSFPDYLKKIANPEVSKVVRKITEDLLNENAEYRTKRWPISIEALRTLYEKMSDRTK
ncbi:MAG: protein kinase [Methanocellales archaeon]|nr:protein kinase [Methanocellales archaeon]MDD5485285.1 protein kinase [Methanocellales archaeon]